MKLWAKRDRCKYGNHAMATAHGYTVCRKHEVLEKDCDLGIKH